MNKEKGFGFNPFSLLIGHINLAGSCQQASRATDPNYFNYYGLQIDNTGGYRKDLFEFPTIRNERIYK